MNINEWIEKIRRNKGPLSGIALAVLIVLVILLFVIKGGAGNPGSTPAEASGGTSAASSAPANSGAPTPQGSTPANGTSTTTAPPTSGAPVNNTTGAPAPGTTMSDDPYSGRSAGCMEKANQASHIPAVIDPAAASMGMSIGDNQFLGGGVVNAACLYSVTLPREPSESVQAYCQNRLVPRVDNYLLNQGGTTYKAFFDNVAQRYVTAGLSRPDFGGLDDYRKTKYNNPVYVDLRGDAWFKVQVPVCTKTKGYTDLSIDVSSVGVS